LNAADGEWKLLLEPELNKHKHYSGKQNKNKQLSSVWKHHSMSVVLPLTMPQREH